MMPQHIAINDANESIREPNTSRHLRIQTLTKHDTDVETASLSSSDGTLSSKSSKTSKSSKSSSKEKKKKSKDAKRTSKQSKSTSEAKKKKSKSKKNETPPVSPTPTEILRVNAKKIQTMIALKKAFGHNAEELVEREDRSDRKYRRRSMDLTSTLGEDSGYMNVVYDWGMPLANEPPSNKEENSLKSCIATSSGKSVMVSQKKVHWPSSVEALCTVRSIVGYDESLVKSCFYNGTDFNSFRLDKFIEDHPDEYEWVDEEEEVEYEEFVEEEIVYEYIEEEIIEETPLRPMMSRRTSL
jgi:chemotaxis protein histidine kinase CheA